MDTLFDSPCRYMSDSELLYEISNNRQIVSDIERSNEVIDLEKLFSLKSATKPSTSFLRVHVLSLLNYQIT